MPSESKPYYRGGTAAGLAWGGLLCDDIPELSDLGVSPDLEAHLFLGGKLTLSVELVWPLLRSCCGGQHQVRGDL